ncbi:MAG TPA: heparinase II/III family protein, partial [Armatimonadota bacterium]|nr:heparinase II/III family protein [Armatimonadota bacterium]
MLHANMLGGLALLMSVVICSSAMAYPVKHPVFPVELTDAEVDSLREQATHVMSLGREQIDEFIVPRTTFYHILCPNCDDGNVSDTYHWLWSPEEPDQIECKFCNMVFPNEEYPLDKETRVTDSTGQEHVYRYWEGEDGYKHFMQMRVENCKKRYMESMAGALAKIYHATGDEPHARQAGIILNRLAEVYPHYSPHGIENWSMFAMKVFDTQPLPRPPNGLQPVPGMAKDLPGYSTPYPYCSTLRGDGLDNWFYSEMSPALARTYDRVADSEAVDALSDELGTDVRRNIEEFHRATANFTRTFPIYLGNMDGSLIRGLAVIGRVIGEPEFVHDALRRVDGILERQFYPDGIWREASPSYHSQTVYSLQSCVEGPLKGYSDPEGYVNPIDGLHIDRFSGASDVPMLEESIAALNRMRLPDGEVTPIHDAWPAANLGRPIPEAREGPVGTALAWAMGHAILGVGAGESGVQANLHFSGGYGHQHADALDLLLFGAGRQLLPDLGYTHTILRPFACSTVAHNSVVVNEANQRSSGDDPPADGALMAWARCGDLLRFCEASSEGAYPDIASLYRRALALVALPGGGGYVVDVFRVTGGDKHDWCLHGSADYDQTLEASLPMQPHAAGLLPPGWARRPWTDTIAQSWNPVVDGVNTLYGLFEDVAHGDGAQAWSATFRYADDPSRGLHTSLLGQPDTTVYTAALPSIRRAKESNAAVFDHTMPALL